MRGSGSPISMSTTREPPNAVCMKTMPGGSGRTSPMIAAYSLILFALSIAPLAIVAPLRETGVVLVALWGVFVLHERVRAAGKLVGAVAVVAGAALLTIG